jgi:hypothetical protein
MTQAAKLATPESRWLPAGVLYLCGGGDSDASRISSISSEPEPTDRQTNQTLRKLVVLLLLRSAVPPPKSSALIWAYREEIALWYL